jgi:cytochrome P450
VNIKDITLDHFKKLSVADMIWKETLRLYPPAQNVPRYAAKDMEMCGYHIPKGTTIMAFTEAMQRDPEFWKDPNKFDPQRWENAVDTFRYMPFSRGARQCIGIHFATLEGKLTIAAAARHFKWRYAGNEPIGNNPVENREYPMDGLKIRSQLVIPPENGVPIKVTRLCTG